MFAHYLNVALCHEVLRFVEWYRAKFPAEPQLTSEVCVTVAATLAADYATTQPELYASVKGALRRVEILLNNLGDGPAPRLSAQGQPVDELCAALLNLSQFKGKSIFFVIDEFENLLDYQQVVVNTLLKHCGEYYSFKIGVRELGWRKRATLNENEQLVSPADYERIDIGKRLDAAKFAKFAQEVFWLRARRQPGLAEVGKPDNLFPSLTAAEEAQKLGINVAIRRIRKEMRGQGIGEGDLDGVPPLELYFVHFWATAKGLRFSTVLDERARNVRSWKTRFDNYKFAMLFSIHAKKTGIRKYYCGWSTFLRMANGNIRYLLELVAQALDLHREEEGAADLNVAPEIQTRAAQVVGSKNLAELEGLSVKGARLTKLLLGLGRLFEVLAAKPNGHAPEYTQFYFRDEEVLSPDVKDMLDGAVMHLALVRSVSSKREELETKEWDYAIHPIYSAFFVFSHRRKRKLLLTGAQVRRLADEPRTAIRDTLARYGTAEEVGLPTQMQLFEAYYNETAG